MQLTNIRIIYQSNYNGVCLVTETDDTYELTEFPEHAKKAEFVQNVICNYAHRDCDEDGCYQGSIMDLSQEAIKFAKECFGEDITYCFEEDDRSS